MQESSDTIPDVRLEVVPWVFLDQVWLNGTAYRLTVVGRGWLSVCEDFAAWFQDRYPRFEELLGCLARAWPRDTCRRCGGNVRDGRYHSYGYSHHLVAKVTEAECTADARRSPSSRTGWCWTCRGRVGTWQQPAGPTSCAASSWGRGLGWRSRTSAWSAAPASSGK